MLSLGVHFALSAEQLKQLRGAVGDDDAVLEFMAELEEAWDRKWLVESDKAWAAMHRALADGELTFEGGLAHAPLGTVVLGGESLVEDEDATVVLLTARSVAASSKALAKLTKKAFRARYDAHCADSPEFGDADFEYTWENLEEVAALFAKAAKAKRAVVFSVDQ